MVFQPLRDREGCLKVGNIGSSPAVGGAVVNDGSAQRGDVLVSESDVPNHHFVDHAFKIRISCAVDA